MEFARNRSRGASRAQGSDGVLFDGASNVVVRPDDEFIELGVARPVVHANRDSVGARRAKARPVLLDPLTIANAYPWPVAENWGLPA